MHNMYYWSGHDFQSLLLSTIFKPTSYPHPTPKWKFEDVAKQLEFGHAPELATVQKCKGCSCISVMSFGVLVREHLSPGSRMNCSGVGYNLDPCLRCGILSLGRQPYSPFGQVLQFSPRNIDWVRWAPESMVVHKIMMCIIMCQWFCFIETLLLTQRKSAGLSPRFRVVLHVVRLISKLQQHRRSCAYVFFFYFYFWVYLKLFAHCKYVVVQIWIHVHRRNVKCP